MRKEFMPNPLSKSEHLFNPSTLAEGPKTIDLPNQKRITLVGIDTDDFNPAGNTVSFIHAYHQDQSFVFYVTTKEFCSACNLYNKGPEAYHNFHQYTNHEEIKYLLQEKGVINEDQLDSFEFEGGGVIQAKDPCKIIRSKSLSPLPHSLSDTVTDFFADYFQYPTF